MDTVVGGPVDTTTSTARRLSTARLSNGDRAASAGQADARCGGRVIVGTRTSRAARQLSQRPIAMSRPGLKVEDVTNS